MSNPRKDTTNGDPRGRSAQIFARSRYGLRNAASKARRAQESSRTYHSHFLHKTIKADLFLPMLLAWPKFAVWDCLDLGTLPR